MVTGIVSHQAESRSITDFLGTAAAKPAALIVGGEAGIGKTTLWLAAVEEARGHGFTVLSARAAAAESVLAYGALTDLLDEVAYGVFADLPDPQRLALDRIRLQVSGDGHATDQRAVTAGFLSVVQTLANSGPVLVAIDDAQWLDASSQQVLGLVARRLPGQVRILVTERIDAGNASTLSWLECGETAVHRRIHMSPLSFGGIQAVISQRLGRSFSRPTMVQIQKVSGGNPFYALELARAIGKSTVHPGSSLPGTLADLVRARIGNLDSDVRDILLAASCDAAPTIELVARAIGADAEYVTRILANAQDNGIVGIDGQRIRFTHPLLIRGVYTLATSAQRRAMHRRLAAIVEQPELRARHLGLAANTGDVLTLQSLDAAAESARSRGAPTEAAEFLDLAIRLGGDTPQRRIRLASHLLNAGDTGRARALLEETIAALEPGALKADASNLLGFLHLFGESFLAAAGVLERALDEARDDLGLRTHLLVTLAYARYNSGHFGRATRRIDEAIIHAERLGQPMLLSQAIGLRVILGFLRGDGLDRVRMTRAQGLEDIHTDMPMAFRPRMQNAMLLAWTGQLDHAHCEMQSIQRRCIERGEENELIFVAIHRVLLQIWRGDFTDAALIAEDTVERAAQLGGDVPLFVAMTIRAALAAYAGRVDDARRDTTEALMASSRSGADLLVVWTLTTLGFLELSLGNHEATLNAVAPLLARLDAAPEATEIVAAAFIPDAVEALVHLNRLDEAERLVDILERNGRRLDRAWMLAVGARCRAMLLAARGDVDAALLSAQHAMTEHDRLPMPFERARTQLLLGQLQRRHRLKDDAATTLGAAWETFEGLGIPLWAKRARAELDRSNTGPRQGGILTPSEQRVANLAASGMTNRSVAAALFVSPKTVEAHLARIYHKLGISSRAELGRRMSATP